MNRFFSRNMFFIATVFFITIFSITFISAGFTKDQNQGKGSFFKEVIGRKAKQGGKKAFTKREVDVMKTYLNYDMGYGFNDALERQNIFSDGFFLDLIGSSFGKDLVSKNFSLIEKDFAAKVDLHRKTTLYQHASKKFKLENILASYYPKMYEKYKLIVNPSKKVDVHLLHDLMELSVMQKDCTPASMQRLCFISARDMHLEKDPLLEQKNFALFHAKNNEDLFGEAFMELLAEAVLYGARVAKNSYSSSSYEEAFGVILRRAYASLTKKYPRIEEKKELEGIKNSYEKALGLSREELINAAESILTFQKMIKDVENSVVLDLSFSKHLFSEKVDTLLVSKVEDSSNMTISSPQDALELQCYLECIGKTDEFISVPKKCYENQELLIKAFDLMKEEYSLKISSCTKEEIIKTFPLKKVWQFQVRDDGWQSLCLKFLFDSKILDRDRFRYLQGLDPKLSSEVEQYCREKMFEMEPKIAKELLLKCPLKKEKIFVGANATIGKSGLGLDENLLIEELKKMQEGEEISSYSQDKTSYFRFVLLKKPNKERVCLSFKEAKDSLVLSLLVDKKLIALNKGKSFTKDQKEALLHLLLKKEANQGQALEIIEGQKNKLYYVDHQKKRLESFKKNELLSTVEPLLDQFSLKITTEVIAKDGENKHLALDEFFKLKKGEISSFKPIGRGNLYYVQLIEKKINQDKLTTLLKKMKKEIVDEALNSMYTKLISNFDEDKKSKNNDLKGV